MVSPVPRSVSCAPLVWGTYPAAAGFDPSKPKRLTLIMTTASSAPNPVLKAAAPVLVSAIDALQEFESDMGTTPLQWAANYQGARLKLLGNLGLLLPQLANAEGGALESVITTTTTSWKTELQAWIAAPATPPAAQPALTAAVVQNAVRA
jgi:hypothetical protein